MTSLEADKIGASVAKNHYSRVRVDGANVLTNCSKNKPQKASSSIPPPESCDIRLAE